MIPVIDKESCTGCGDCLEICPPQAICFQNEKAHIEDDLCEECGFCVAECSVEAIALPFPLYGST
jgi:MinD superfamily P-loop ATPase